MSGTSCMHPTRTGRTLYGCTETGASPRRASPSRPRGSTLRLRQRRTSGTRSRASCASFLSTARPWPPPSPCARSAAFAATTAPASTTSFTLLTGGTSSPLEPTTPSVSGTSACTATRKRTRQRAGTRCAIPGASETKMTRPLRCRRTASCWRRPTTRRSACTTWRRDPRRRCTSSSLRRAGTRRGARPSSSARTAATSQSYQATRRCPSADCEMGSQASACACCRRATPRRASPLTATSSSPGTTPTRTSSPCRTSTGRRATRSRSAPLRTPAAVSWCLACSLRMMAP
mmetsp:Transcript_35000/g.110071  ORF Transcript_35000/g.110071 Transcript_35000/m.110071 type:complete len:289 (+) Transcript_35000:1030-1896(+)